jgi:hypothetical protein
MSTIDRYDLGWPVAPSVAASYSKVNKPATIERIREALEKCGIQSEHAVKAIMEIIEDERR